MKKSLLLLFLISIVLSGCGVNPVQKKGDTVTVKGESGESLTFGAKEIPSNFPKDIPIYPGSKPVGSYVATGQDSGIIVGLETGDDFERVVAYYSEELTKNGWTVTGQTGVTASSAVYPIKKGETSGVITIQKQEEQKNVAIAIVLGKEIKAEGVDQ
jgi:hypothetical protein